MIVTFSTQDKNKRAQESYRSLKRVPAKESKEEPNSRNVNKRGYEFSDEDVEEIYDELLKHDKIRPLATKRPEEAGMTNHPLYCRYH